MSENNDLQSIREKNSVHSIPMRLEFIRELVGTKDLTPLINFEGGEEDSCASYDTRIRLKKHVCDFRSAINQLSGRLTYIKSGTTGHTFHGVSAKGDFEYAVKVVAYPKKEKYGDLYDIRRPENAEIMMTKVLSNFVVRKQTPHIILPIISFYTNIRNFVGLVEKNIVDKNNKKYNEFVDRYNNDEYYDDVSVLITEWANRGDLLDFIRNRYKQFLPIHWKAIFFQILYTLAIIQVKYPKFRHNDLKANNILVHRIDKTTDKFGYRLAGTEYLINNIGYQIKFCDFDFACIPDIVPNQKVTLKWTAAINISPEQNRYYDLHYFFNTLIKKGFFPEFLTSPHVPQETKDFVYRVLPEKYRTNERYVHERGRILINDEYMTPDAILKTDPYFDEFRVKRPPKKIDDIFKVESDNDQPMISDLLKVGRYPRLTGR